uniref:Predicted protein n=1 Tax=Hordeum vulgare subsp. vulgare TaxID=112509 RepID=F2CWJ7_HORVV|nr:predicted protein [Hordeum vulgare subsp. vulgare]
MDLRLSGIDGDSIRGIGCRRRLWRCPSSCTCSCFSCLRLPKSLWSTAKLVHRRT